MVPGVARAAELLGRAGVDADDALPAVVSLARGSLTSLVEGGVAEAGGGVRGRADAETVALHLRALDPGDQRLYVAFTRELIHLTDAVAGGAPDAERAEVEALLAPHLTLEPTGAGG